MEQASYRARVGDVAQREEALAVYLAMRAATGKADAFENDAAIAIREKYDGRLAEAMRAYEKQRGEILAERGEALAKLEPSPEAAALRAAADKAEKAWQDVPGEGFVTHDDDDDDDDDDDTIRCALSGLPIFDSDPVLTDEATGETVLKACLGLPLDQESGAFAVQEKAA